jgi:hypothetical protein
LGGLLTACWAFGWVLLTGGGRLSGSEFERGRNPFGELQMVFIETQPSGLGGGLQAGLNKMRGRSGGAPEARKNRPIGEVVD